MDAPAAVWLGCHAIRTTVDLHDLYRQHDELWKKFTATPGEERREASMRGWEGDGPADVAFHALSAKAREIDAHPDARDFEADLREVLGDRIRASADGPGMYGDPLAPGENVAVDVYASLCNVNWEHEAGSRYGCSWRYAGGLIAEICGRGDYLDWYCSGGEGHVADYVAEAMATRGWRVAST